jgi:hypothetical protein
VVLATCVFSLNITGQVLKFRTKARIRVTPPIHRLLRASPAASVASHKRSRFLLKHKGFHYRGPIAKQWQAPVFPRLLIINSVPRGFA